MNLEDTVWRMIGISGSECGVLTLADGCFAFDGERGTRFDVPVSAISAVTFPWYYFGGGVKVSIGADNYRFSFIEPHNSYASISDARATGARWKTALSTIINKNP